MLQIKVIKDLISYKKVSGRICLSPTGVKLGLQRLSSLKY